VSGITRVARVALNTFDAETLARFYVDVLGFARIRDAGNAIALALGDTRLDLIEVDREAHAYPLDVPGWSPLFQHFAIVVSDIEPAMKALCGSSGWSAISLDGAQRLPANTGGVTAFKFRDPDGHPLELLAFPDTSGVPANGTFMRIDHSAISVADVERSIAFYESLGLSVIGRSLNVGGEQQKLDAIADATVDIVGLAPSRQSKPHVELLCYRGPHDREATLPTMHDVAATRLIFEVEDDRALTSILEAHDDAVVIDATCSSNRTRLAILRDPDGHLLQFEVDL
jgi:catechol 2,3-dioxygenase-like lactoylglutathione lyase family enzyme